jgi:tagatose-1,6-bisphosphate aldolase
MELFVGETAWSREEAASHFRRAASAISKPFVYLPAGVTNSAFIGLLEFALQYGPGFMVCFLAALRGEAVFRGLSGRTHPLCRNGCRYLQDQPHAGVRNSLARRLQSESAEPRLILEPSPCPQPRP